MKVNPLILKILPDCEKIIKTETGPYLLLEPEIHDIELVIGEDTRLCWQVNDAMYEIPVELK